MRIGVLAAQGAFIEHMAALRQLGVETVLVRLPRELGGLDGLILPGGESTTISQLLVDYNLLNELKKLAQNGLPIFGTCAGMILLANDVPDPRVKPLAVMQIKVKRNAFGRQRESFEMELTIPVLGVKSFPGVFIRAPAIEQVSSEVAILSRIADGTIVAAREGKLLVSAFHPELTDDLRLHQYFLDIVAERQ